MSLQLLSLHIISENSLIIFFNFVILLLKLVPSCHVARYCINGIYSAIITVINQFCLAPLNFSNALDFFFQILANIFITQSFMKQNSLKN